MVVDIYIWNSLICHVTGNTKQHRSSYFTKKHIDEVEKGCKNLGKPEKCIKVANRKQEKRNWGYQINNA